VTADKPNILFILADDLGWGDVSYHGSPIRTPNVDRLRQQGVELDHHYVCPMCTPTRASLLTGQHPGRFGTHATAPSNAPVLPDGYETLATALRDAGYDTGLFGKWHLGSDPAYGPNRFGFNHAYGSLAGGVDPWNHRYKRGPESATWHRNGEIVEERGHVTDLIVREAVDWIESRDSPWFAYVPFTAVHTPVDAPHEWLDRYALETYDGDPVRDLSFKRYAAYTSHMDWAVGELVDALKRISAYDETLVVFSSDNGAISEGPIHDTDKYPGWHFLTPRLGSNGELRGQKAQLYEGGIRTPTVVSWPGTLAPHRCESPVQVVDWMPTLCTLTGARMETDPHRDGRDVWSIVTGADSTDPGRPFFWNFRGSEFCLRQADYKLIRGTSADPNAVELYDLAVDPREQHDLAAQEPKVVKHLTGLIEQEREKDGRLKRADA
jgi:arylsulfatase A-like enzyme